MEFFRKLFHLLFGGLNDTGRWNDLIGYIGQTNIYVVLFLIIFCETGLVIAPFLPGDSLLFVAGSFCSDAPGANLSLPVLCGILPIAAIVGDNLNYWIGRFIGSRVFKREKSIFFNTEILQRTHNFY